MNDLTLFRSAHTPSLVLRGSWANRPPLAVPQHGEFTLRHSSGWTLDEPYFAGGASDPGWVQSPAGILVAPEVWFTDPEASAVTIPGREVVAGRVCSRVLVSYSRHSRTGMVLWLDEEWPLVLAARSEGSTRFEVRATEIHELAPVG